MSNVNKLLQDFLGTVLTINFSGTYYIGIK